MKFLKRINRCFTSTNLIFGFGSHISDNNPKVIARETNKVLKGFTNNKVCTINKSDI